MTSVQQPPATAREAPAAAAVAGMARAGAANLVGVAVSGVFGFLLVLVVTRGLGAARAGVYLEAVALFTIVSTAMKLGADTGLVRTLARQVALRRTGDLCPTVLAALVPVVAAGLAVAAGVYALAGPIAHVFMAGPHVAEGAEFIRVFAAFVPLGCISTVALAGTRGLGGVLPLIGLQFVGQPVLRVLLTAVLVSLGAGGLALAAGWALPLGISAVAAVALLARAVVRHSAEPLRIDLGESARLRTLARDFWAYSSGRGVAAAFEILTLWIGIPLVGALSTTQDAAVFGAANRLVTTGLLVMGALRMGFAPQISALLARRDFVGVGDLHLRLTGWVILSSWPVYLAFACFGTTVLRLFGHGFGSGGTTLVILAVAMLINLGTGNSQTIVLMGANSRWNLANSGACLALSVGLMFLLVPRFGVVGAALAWAVSIVAENVACAIEIRYLLGVRPVDASLLRAALPSLLCFGALGALTRLVLGDRLLVMAAYLLAGLVAYLIVLWSQRTALGLDILFAALRPDRAERPDPAERPDHAARPDGRAIPAPQSQEQTGVLI